MQHAIRSGAALLVRSLLNEDVFDIAQIDAANKKSGRLSLLHEAVQCDNADVLDAVLEASCAKDFAHDVTDVSIHGIAVAGVTPAVYLALMPLFLPDLATDADACERRANMLDKLLESSEILKNDCGPRSFRAQAGAAEISALACAALLCHAFPMHRVLSVRAAASPAQTVTALTIALLSRVTCDSHSGVFVRSHWRAAQNSYHEQTTRSHPTTQTAPVDSACAACTLPPAPGAQVSLTHYLNAPPLSHSKSGLRVGAGLEVCFGCGHRRRRCCGCVRCGDGFEASPPCPHREALPGCC